MPVYRISVINESFTASNEYELASVAAAQSYAVKGALNIGTDEIVAGKSFFGAEVKIETDGEPVVRFMVSVGASPLQ